jgi:hypothetical protein
MSLHQDITRAQHRGAEVEGQLEAARVILADIRYQGAVRDWAQRFITRVERERDAERHPLLVRCFAPEASLEVR